MQGRITFPGNPWPEGHPIKVLDLHAALTGHGVELRLHLESENYYSERDLPVPDCASDELSGWESSIVWDNYHACTMSNTKWDEGPPLRLDRDGERFRFSDLQGQTRLANPVPLGEDGLGIADHEWGFDDLVFSVYLLGHDAVANHRIVFTKATGTHVDLDWSGLVARAYVGRYRFEHRFHAYATNVPFLGYQCPSAKGTPFEGDAAAREVAARRFASSRLHDVDAMTFRPAGAGERTDVLVPPGVRLPAKPASAMGFTSYTYPEETWPDWSPKQKGRRWAGPFRR